MSKITSSTFTWWTWMLGQSIRRLFMGRPKPSVALKQDGETLVITLHGRAYVESLRRDARRSGAVTMEEYVIEALDTQHHLVLHFEHGGNVLLRSGDGVTTKYFEQLPVTSDIQE